MVERWVRESSEDKLESGGRDGRSVNEEMS